MGSRGSFWIALAVIVLLAVRMLSSGLALGSVMSAEAMSGEAGQTFAPVICSSHSHQSGTPSDQAPIHSHQTDCCTAECPMLGGGLLPAVFLALWLTIEPVQKPFFIVARGFGTLASASHSPPRTRAPPVNSPAEVG